MQAEETGLPGVIVLTPERYEDERGFLSETYSRTALRGAGIEVDFVQDNHSYSARTGTIRGLHFQVPPFAQDKLIRVVHGSAFDVAIDLRQGSPTYGTWTGVELSATRWNQVFIPAGFAHAFCTLERDTHLVYKVSQPYAAESEGGLAWNDPDLAIEWPSMDRYLISEKDRKQSWFSDFVSPFRFPLPDAAQEDAP